MSPLEQLDAQLTLAVTARAPRRVLVSGPEGVGRTHLFKHAMTLPVVRVAVGEGPLMAQTLRALLPPVVDDEARFSVLQVAPQLRAFEPARAELARELLGSLLGITRPGGRTAALDERSRREGAALELARWVFELASARGLLVAFDDAHLADDDGLSFIDLLAGRDEPVPLCLAVGYDADGARHSAAFQARVARWQAEARWERLVLEPPPEGQVRELLVAAGASVERAAGLARVARGNPGLALELHRSLDPRVSLEEVAVPASFDALRLRTARALTPGVFRAAVALAALGGRVPLAALSSKDSGLGLALYQGVSANLLCFERVAALEVVRFVDRRMAGALAGALPEGEAASLRAHVSAWCARALDEVDLAAFAQVAEVLVPLARPALSPDAASAWHEAWAEMHRGEAQALAHLELALEHAQGIRRLVVLRRMAEGRLFAGAPDEALALVQRAGRPGKAPSQALPEGTVGRLLGAQPRGPLDRWEALTADEAMVALELTRAECQAYLLKREETQLAFSELERKLTRLDGPAVHHLWMGWARAWATFITEVLGRPEEAARVCAVVRARVPAAMLEADHGALDFMRAEELAVSGSGALRKGQALAEAYLALAERSGRLRHACLAWNARALVRFGLGELREARGALERAVELARTIGWPRREAVSTHNLALMLTELGELDAAWDIEQGYARLSGQIANLAARAEAPLVLANLEVARGRLSEAEALVATARKVAEGNDWPLLLAGCRATSGKVRLLRARSAHDGLELSRARNELHAAAELLAEQHVTWSEELDPAEVASLLAVCLASNGQRAEAVRALDQVGRGLHPDVELGHRQLAVARAYLDRAPVDEALRWFEAQGFARRASLWRSLWVNG